MAASSDASPARTFKLAPEDDPLRGLRAEFVIPTNRTMKATAVAPELQDEPCTYLCGNSLGVLPKRARQIVNEELDVWATRGVEGHFDHPYDRDWMHIADTVHPILADLLGASISEVACMGTLTANLNLMLNTFYRPTQTRYKLLCEAKAFPSDQYAMASQVAAHGFDPATAIIELAPRAGEHTLRTEDILSVIRQEGHSIALVLFSGCQYYTGQIFAVKEITAAAKAQGCVCGWDIAHSIGNVPLSLHDWDVDFAVYCTYKYLNAGPGSIGGIFVHERWADEPIRAAGWWGHDPATRFAMPPTFERIRGAHGFQQSNPSVLATAALLGSLQVFAAAGGMSPLRARSVRLTGYFEALLHQSKWWVPLPEIAAFQEGETRTKGGEKRVVGMTVITPKSVEERGAQLSLVFLPTGKGVMPRVMQGLAAQGVVGDSRKPDVIRLAPCPLYNTWEDVERAISVLDEVLAEIQSEGLDVPK